MNPVRMLPNGYLSSINKTPCRYNAFLGFLPLPDRFAQTILGMCLCSDRLMEFRPSLHPGTS